MQSPFDFSREDEEKEIVVRKFNLKKKTTGNEWQVFSNVSSVYVWKRPVCPQT